LHLKCDLSWFQNVQLQMQLVYRYMTAQAFWLPVLSGVAAVAAAGVAAAPVLACLPTVLAACLITKYTAASVGSIASLRALQPMSSKAAAVGVAALALTAAPLALKWQQVVAAASWAVGIGAGCTTCPQLTHKLESVWIQPLSLPLDPS
jgi:hypothetical protein